tara:strand:+ start:749 stop:1177 length:429 start_codon:yes stop_codon:yes gene_type:complete
MKYSINILALLIFCFIGNSQTKLNDSLIYEDKFGNEIIIKNPEKFSFPFDSEFLKSNLNSDYFLEKPTKYKYRLNIKFVKIIRKKRKCKIEVSIFPLIEKPYKQEDIEELLRFNGWSYYELVIKKVKNKYFLDEVKFLNNAI